MVNTSESESFESSVDTQEDTPVFDGSYGLITVSGPPGSGATTVARELSETINYEYVNAGNLFREVASDRGLSLNELLEQAENDDTLDRSLDARLQRIIEQHDFTESGLVLEARLAGWVAGDNADFKVWLDAPTDVRVERTKYRMHEDVALQERETNEATRYEKYYGIDIEDTKFYDLHINTARWRPEAVLKVVETALDEYIETHDEGVFEKEFDPVSDTHTTR